MAEELKTAKEQGIKSVVVAFIPAAMLVMAVIAIIYFKDEISAVVAIITLVDQHEKRITKVEQAEKGTSDFLFSLSQTPDTFILCSSQDLIIASASFTAATIIIGSPFFFKNLIETYLTILLICYF